MPIIEIYCKSGKRCGVHINYYFILSSHKKQVFNIELVYVCTNVSRVLLNPNITYITFKEHDIDVTLLSIELVFRLITNNPQRNYLRHPQFHELLSQKTKLCETVPRCHEDASVLSMLINFLYPERSYRKCHDSLSILNIFYVMTIVFATLLPTEYPLFTTLDNKAKPRHIATKILN